MESSLMAQALLNDAKSLDHQSGDWERDFTRLQRCAEVYEQLQAIRAKLAQIGQFFRGPTAALNGAHA